MKTLLAMPLLFFTLNYLRNPAQAQETRTQNNTSEIDSILNNPKDQTANTVFSNTALDQYTEELIEQIKSIPLLGDCENSTQEEGCYPHEDLPHYGVKNRIKEYLRENSFAKLTYFASSKESQFIADILNSYIVRQEELHSSYIVLHNETKDCVDRLTQEVSRLKIIEEGIYEKYFWTRASRHFYADAKSQSNAVLALNRSGEYFKKYRSYLENPYYIVDETVAPFKEKINKISTVLLDNLFAQVRLKSILKLLEIEKFLRRQMQKRIDGNNNNSVTREVTIEIRDYMFAPYKILNDTLTDFITEKPMYFNPDMTQILGLGSQLKEWQNDIEFGESVLKRAQETLPLCEERVENLKELERIVQESMGKGTRKIKKLFREHPTTLH